MMFEIGQHVRILESAFGASVEPQDIFARGKNGVITEDLAASLGDDWQGCYEVRLDENNALCSVLETEIEALN